MLAVSSYVRARSLQRFSEIGAVRRAAGGGPISGTQANRRSAEARPADALPARDRAHAAGATTVKSRKEVVQGRAQLLAIRHIIPLSSV